MLAHLLLHVSDQEWSLLAEVVDLVEALDRSEDLPLLVQSRRPPSAGPVVGEVRSDRFRWESGSVTQKSRN